MGVTRIHHDGRRDDWYDDDHFAQIDTTRTYSRSVREAFREWPENALGIAGPVVIPLCAPWWVRALRWMLRAD